VDHESLHGIHLQMVRFPIKIGETLENYEKHAISLVVSSIVLDGFLVLQ
jgi:hypothetical protein